MKLNPTTEGRVAPARAAAGERSGLAAPLVALALALLAGLPRAWGLADFLTTDEAYHWITRTERFAAAIAGGRWAETIQTGHPGVSLMWLAGLGLRLEQAAVAAGLAAAPDRLGHLAWLRLAPAIVNALCVGLGYLLLRRLVRPGAALLAGLLWATSPYLVAHGRLIHLDALLTSFVSLALLATMAACRAARPWPWLAAAGAALGLALLTKGPALIALPPLGLALFALDEAPWSLAPRPLAARLLRALGRYAALLAVAAAVALLLWPALWAAPQQAVGRYLAEIIGNGGRPNGDGQFFLGRAVGDPGPLFYLVAGLYRLTPLELAGLLALPLALLRPAEARERRALIALALFVAFWTLVMTLGPKKFDRYTLPSWPALLALSAAGLAALGGWLRARLPAARPALGLGLALALQGGLLAWYHPYYLSYYSPLLGGGPAAQRLFLIGWGEGMEQVGAYLRSRPDIGEGQVVSSLPPTLQPFVPVPVQNVYAIDAAAPNYAVAYLESLQRGAYPAIYERITATVPLHTVTIHGIEYARVYQLPRPFERPVGARFGPGLALAGVSLSREGGRLVVTPAWDVRAPVGGDYTLFLHLFDAAGARVAQADIAPGGASRPPTGAWLPGEQIAVPIPLDLPAGLAPGPYRVVAGLYDAAGARLPLLGGPAADPAVAGPDAALLAEITLE